MVMSKVGLYEIIRIRKSYIIQLCCYYRNNSILKNYEHFFRFGRLQCVIILDGQKWHSLRSGLQVHSLRTQDFFYFLFADSRALNPCDTGASGQGSGALALRCWKGPDTNEALFQWMGEFRDWRQ